MVEKVSSAEAGHRVPGAICAMRVITRHAQDRAAALRPAGAGVEPAVPALGAMPEAALRCLVDLGLSDREIARYFGLHVGLVERLRRDFGLEAARPGGAA